jgi:hypothetical protein
MNIRHRGDPLKDERHLRSIEQLLARLVLDRHTLGPGLDRNALLLRVHVVALVCHCLSPLEAYLIALAFYKANPMPNWLEEHMSIYLNDLQDNRSIYHIRKTIA